MSDYYHQWMKGDHVVYTVPVTMEIILDQLPSQEWLDHLENEGFAYTILGRVVKGSVLVESETAG